MPKDIQIYSISTGTMLRFLAILLFLGLVYVVRDIIMALIFAVIVASAIEPAVVWLKARKIPRILGAVIIYLCIGVLFFFGVFLIVPLLADEFQNVSLTVPTLQEKLLEVFKGANLPFIPFLGETNIQDILNIPLDYLRNLSQGVFSFASVIFGGIFSFIVIVVLSFYLLAQEKGIE